MFTFNVDLARVAIALERIASALELHNPPQIDLIQPEAPFGREAIHYFSEQEQVEWEQKVKMALEMASSDQPT